MNSSEHSVARDVFLYLLMIVVLGMGAGHLGALIFRIITLAFPEPGEIASVVTSAMRFPLAALVVVVPVLAWIMRFLHRDIAAHPEKRDLKIRKWLIYLTLFVAGLFVIGDLIGLINGYLNGDLTLRFALKFLTILVIAGSIFYYYLHELRWEGRGRAAIVGWAMVGLAIVAVGYGFIQVGSPATQRARNLDAQRAQDLSEIQSQIVNFWQSKERLPQTLAELEDSISGFQVPTDPETEVPYEYSRTGTLQFTLCATFTMASEEDVAPTAYREPFDGRGNWDHDAGRTCFERVIDPELYPPKTQIQ